MVRLGNATNKTKYIAKGTNKTKPNIDNQAITRHKKSKPLQSLISKFMKGTPMKMYNPKLNSAKSAFEHVKDMQNSGLVKTAKLLARLYAGMSDGGITESGGAITEAGGTSTSFSSTF